MERWKVIGVRVMRATGRRGPDVTNAGRDNVRVVLTEQRCGYR